MAEALLKAKCPDRTIISAGIHAMTGFPADAFSIKVMAENGFDITGHRARQLNNEMVKQADLILTMDKRQSKFIENDCYPGHQKNIIRIGEFGNFDVPDPYMQSINAFKKTYQLLMQGVDDVIKHVLSA